MFLVYHALVELRDGAEEVEGANVPDLGVADDLQSPGVEHAAQRLVQLVQLVDLALGPVVPQHPVTQHQLVRGVEAGAVVAVVIGVPGAQGGDGLACGEVIDGRHALRSRADHLVLGKFDKSYIHVNLGISACVSLHVSQKLLDIARKKHTHVKYIWGLGKLIFYF